MILLTILALVLVLMLLGTIMFAAMAICIGGGMAVVLFGDVFVCIFILVWIIRKLLKKKKGKD